MSKNIGLDHSCFNPLRYYESDPHKGASLLYSLSLTHEHTTRSIALPVACLRTSRTALSPSPRRWPTWRRARRSTCKLGSKAADVSGCEAWVVHPWSLGELPAGLPDGAPVIGVLVEDFHRTLSQSERRWQFVGSRMVKLAAECRQGDATAISAALRSVRSADELHLALWLAQSAESDAAATLIPGVDRRCDPFTQWRPRTSRRHDLTADLLAVNEASA